MINKVKGTIEYSIYEYNQKKIVLEIFEFVVKKLGFQMVEMPILEYTELFQRTNPNSEMVKKEMFNFTDKGNRNLVLRPEGTASFIRMFVNNKWYNQNEIDKFAYSGPMFRYERPQNGRYRQFYQTGVEFIGNKNPYKDAHVILTANVFLEALFENFNIKKNKFEVLINSIGDNKTRENYQKALKEYLIPYKDQLSELSQERLNSGNVLRILDDKIDSQKDFIKSAPKISEFYTAESKKYLQDVLNILDGYNIKYKISDTLVRGLDYYDEIVFEINWKDKKQELTLIGGGRYSSLISELNGPDLSSVGFGFGVDRFLEILKIFFKNDKNQIHNVPNIGYVPNALVYIFATEKQTSFEKLNELYFGLAFAYGDEFEIIFNFDLIKTKKGFEQAYKQKNRFVIFEDPIISNSDIVIVKNLETNEKTELNLADIDQAIVEFAEFAGLKQEILEI
ncbi:histidine--tRNA ligase [Mycoplasmopsis cricetuli]|uniref:histidine--tRNA ligase n=1 Tax=Mycoplasmopsis cricetuli TaxID=171283 RepID=UPI0004711F0E|nr:histidine--tRNA ligase [Mycoplasmopsis cricetuli]